MNAKQKALLSIGLLTAWFAKEAKANDNFEIDQNLLNNMENQPALVVDGGDAGAQFTAVAKPESGDDGNDPETTSVKKIAPHIYEGHIVDALDHSRDSVAMVPYVAGPSSARAEMMQKVKQIQDHIFKATKGKLFPDVYIVTDEQASNVAIGSFAIGELYRDKEKDFEFDADRALKDGTVTKFVIDYIKQLKARNAAQANNTDADATPSRYVAGGPTGG